MADLEAELDEIIRMLRELRTMVSDTDSFYYRCQDVIDSSIRLRERVEYGEFGK